jgi:hypothetical protein
MLAITAYKSVIVPSCIEDFLKLYCVWHWFCELFIYIVVY